MLINCEECESEISSGAASCPHCGFPVNLDRIPTPKENELLAQRFMRQSADFSSKMQKQKRNNRMSGVMGVFIFLAMGVLAIVAGIKTNDPTFIYGGIGFDVLVLLFVIAIYGAIHRPPVPHSPEMICPHCQKRGDVRTKAVSVKKGIDGTKAAAALLTGGLSLGLSGLSRRENLTEAHCDNCGSTWTF